MNGNKPTVGAVLAGNGRYDDLDAADQALVRAEWVRRIEARRGSLDLAAHFVAEGRTWVDLEEL